MCSLQHLQGRKGQEWTQSRGRPSILSLVFLLCSIEKLIDITGRTQENMSCSLHGEKHPAQSFPEERGGRVQQEPLKAMNKVCIILGFVKVSLSGHPSSQDWTCPTNPGMNLEIFWTPSGRDSLPAPHLVGMRRLSLSLFLSSGPPFHWRAILLQCLLKTNFKD